MVFLQPVHQVPEAGFVPRAPVDDTVIVEGLYLLQQFHHPLPDLLMVQDIPEHITAEGADGGIRSQAGHHPADQLSLLGPLRHLFHHRVQSQVMPDGVRKVPVLHLVLIGKQNAQRLLFHASMPFSQKNQILTCSLYALSGKRSIRPFTESGTVRDPSPG